MGGRGARGLHVVLHSEPHVHVCAALACVACSASPPTLTRCTAPWPCAAALAPLHPAAPAPRRTAVPQVIIGSPDLKANHNIRQVVEVMDGYSKYHRLRKLLEQEMDGRKILIFCETKRGCDEVRLHARARTSGLPACLSARRGAACLPCARVLQHAQGLGGGWVGVCPRRIVFWAAPLTAVLFCAALRSGCGRPPSQTAPDLRAVQHEAPVGEAAQKRKRQGHTPPLHPRGACLSATKPASVPHVRATALGGPGGPCCLVDCYALDLGVCGVRASHVVCRSSAYDPHGRPRPRTCRGSAGNGPLHAASHPPASLCCSSQIHAAHLPHIALFPSPPLVSLAPLLASPGLPLHSCLLPAYQLVRQLRTDGYPALGLHGDKSQQERDWVLQEFKNGTHPIMLATDVAARGLGNVHSFAASLTPTRWPILLGGPHAPRHRTACHATASLPCSSSASSTLRQRHAIDVRTFRPAAATHSNLPSLCVA